MKTDGTARLPGGQESVSLEIARVSQFSSGGARKIEHSHPDGHPLLHFVARFAIGMCELPASPLNSASTRTPAGTAPTAGKHSSWRKQIWISFPHRCAMSRLEVGGRCSARSRRQQCREGSNTVHMSLLSAQFCADAVRSRVSCRIRTNLGNEDGSFRKLH
jgi:hypothetical protein